MSNYQTKHFIRPEYLPVCCHWSDPLQNGNPRLEGLVVFAKMQQWALEIIHDASGHMDASRTLSKLMDRYLWPNTTTTTDYVKSYLVCQLYNRATTRSACPMCFMPTSGIPISYIAFDAFMMPPSYDKYILNVIDLSLTTLLQRQRPPLQREKHWSTLIHFFLQIWNTKLMLEINRRTRRGGQEEGEEERTTRNNRHIVFH